MKTTNRVLIIVGDPASGKTTISAEIHCQLKQAGIPHSVLSCEFHGKLLQRLCPDATAITLNEIEIEEAHSDLDKIYKSATEGNVLLDTGANTVRGLLEWISDTGFLDLTKESSLEIAFLFVGSPRRPESSELLSKLHRFAGADVRWFVAKSPVHQGDFNLLEKTAADIGAIILSPPPVRDRLLEIAYASSTPLSAERLPDSIDVLNKARLQTAGRQIAASLEPIVNFFKK